jgi:Cd2+/Zn2+-exporting ATPase
MGQSTLRATPQSFDTDAGSADPALLQRLAHSVAGLKGVTRLGLSSVGATTVNQPDKVLRLIHVVHDWSTTPLDTVQQVLEQRAGCPTTIVRDAHQEALRRHAAVLVALARQQGSGVDDHNNATDVSDGGSSDDPTRIKETTPTEADMPSSAPQLPWNVLAAGVCWVLSLLSHVGDGADPDDGWTMLANRPQGSDAMGPDSDTDMDASSPDNPWAYLRYFGLLAVLLGLPSVALKAVKTLRRKEFDSNCMMVTAAVGALLLGEWDEAAAVAFLFSVSDHLERRATERARRALTKIANLRPEHCRWIHPDDPNQIYVLPADQIPVGSRLSVRPGDKIAADGVVVQGTSHVDESSLTGEAVPVRKGPQDTVQGGSLNVGHTPLVVQTTSSVADSAVSRLIRLVEDAQANTSETEKLIDAFARAYTPAVVSVAAVLCTVPWIWGTSVGQEWCLRGLILIVIACPCALTISTPVTYAAGLAATAQRGIIIKGGAVLESLGHVRTVMLDKTGTLTEGQFQMNELTALETSSRTSREDMLSYMAMLEASSSHPLSATLLQAAEQEGVSIPTHWRMEDHCILKGEGVTAVVQGEKVYVGNQRLFERLGMYADLPQTFKHRATEWQRKGASVGFVGVAEEGIVGFFCVTDKVRLEAPNAVAMLQQHGLRVEILTGDGDGAAGAVAHQVGIPPDAVHAKLLPEDKLHLVGRRRIPSSRRFLRRNATVLFCGDGVNDGPALAVADVGVAMGEGASSLATEVSDVSLTDSNLDKLVEAIFMGQRVVSTIFQNIGLSLLAKLVVVALTMVGRMNLFGAIASDVGVMLLVTLNGMRLLPSYKDVGQQKRRYASKKYRAVGESDQSTDLEHSDSSHDAELQRREDSEIV